MKISELLEEKVEMCPEACCGKPVTECSCGPTCKHCDCYAKNKAMKESATAGATSSGSVATVAGGVGSMQKRNADGTAKNALDQDSLFGNKKKKPNAKKT